MVSSPDPELPPKGGNLGSPRSLSLTTALGWRGMGCPRAACASSAAGSAGRSDAGGPTGAARGA
eukprot:12649948-Alexandrium_andersonii.AAC.1